jgi:hypothetical protein
MPRFCNIIGRISATTALEQLQKGHVTTNLNRLSGSFATMTH